MPLYEGCVYEQNNHGKTFAWKLWKFGTVNLCTFMVVDKTTKDKLRKYILYAYMYIWFWG